MRRKDKAGLKLARFLSPNHGMAGFLPAIGKLLFCCSVLVLLQAMDKVSRSTSRTLHSHQKTAIFGANFNVKRALFFSPSTAG